ncbi:MAG: M23 family metallopeptidase [Thermodesulfobacteriota bacterium]
MVGLLLVSPPAWFFVERMEGGGPVVTLDCASSYISAAGEYSGTVSDTGRGVRRLLIQLRQAGREIDLLNTVYPGGEWFQEGGTAQAAFRFRIDLEKNGLADGPALIRLTAWDHSWRDWGKGNRADIERRMVIDTKPPRLEVISRQHNINQGGAGLAVYRVSESDTRNGVMVGDHFFPGYSGSFTDPLVYLAFFALDHLQGPDTDMFVTASDPAGNSGRAVLPHYIRKKKFRQDTIQLSDGFLQQKMPEFNSAAEVSRQESGLDKFLAVNRVLREKNEKELTALASKTDPVVRWDGVFQRLPRSAPRAGFADLRSYEYQGKIVDRQYHMGLDLASLANSPIPAGNAGKVVFAGVVGIYGNTVVLDHGCGVFSLYSHLSQMDVTEGDLVNKGHPLGKTGTTGLAGGDHLHYAMLVNTTFVNPIEWWDESWITNNITSKIEEAQP